MIVALLLSWLACLRHAVGWQTDNPCPWGESRPPLACHPGKRPALPGASHRVTGPGGCRAPSSRVWVVTVRVRSGPCAGPARVLLPALPEETSSGRNMVSMAGCYHDLAGQTISPAI